MDITRCVRQRAVILASTITAMAIATISAAPAAAQDGGHVVQVPDGYQVEEVVGGLTYATSLTWDNEGRMYVAEAGGQFVEEPSPPRILRVENGRATEVVNLEGKGVADSMVGLTWHDGGFLITHRAPEDRSGAVSRVTLDGKVTRLFSGIIDSQSEHQLNDIKVGPDGRVYVASGPAFNSAVAGIDVAPFIDRSPQVHTTPCQDIVLTGQNFETPDFRTKDPSDKARTGAYVPFGTETTPGQRIEGTNKCGGAILVFDPDDPEGTLEPYAWGLRNVIGFAWDADGEMYAAVNGYDVRGSRPVNDEYDATYRIKEGTWYGWPDYSAALEPLTDPKFDVPDSLQSPVFVDGEQLQGKKRIGFVIDHEASGLTVADKSLIYGLHEVNSSPSLIDFAPDSWGGLAGQLFTAEWGDLAPGTTPLRDAPAGQQVTRIDPDSGTVVPFARNAKPGPASAQGAMGRGFERPSDVKFGPDGAMYISDYGVAKVNFVAIKQGKPPYEFPAETGAVWKITRAGEAPDEMPGTGGGGLSGGRNGLSPLWPLAVLGLATVLPVGLAVRRWRPRHF